MTEGDNRNVLTAQMAAETLGVRNVVAKVNDPVRAEAYAALGIATICRTAMVVEAIASYIGLSSDVEAMGVIRATGHHHGEQTDAGDHDGPDVGSRPARRSSAEGRARRVRHRRRRRQGRLLPDP